MSVIVAAKSALDLMLCPLVYHCCNDHQKFQHYILAFVQDVQHRIMHPFMSIINQLSELEKVGCLQILTDENNLANSFLLQAIAQESRKLRCKNLLVAIGSSYP